MSNKNTIELPRLKQVRVSKLLTQDELATKAGLSTEFISRLERSRQRCGVTTAKKLVAALEVSIEELSKPYPETSSG